MSESFSAETKVHKIDTRGQCWESNIFGDLDHFWVNTLEIHTCIPTSTYIHTYIGIYLEKFIPCRIRSRFSNTHFVDVPNTSILPICTYVHAWRNASQNFFPNRSTISSTHFVDVVVFDDGVETGVQIVEQLHHLAMGHTCTLKVLQMSLLTRSTLGYLKNQCYDKIFLYNSALI
jgi:hypothetical protein